MIGAALLAVGLIGGASRPSLGTEPATAVHESPSRDDLEHARTFLVVRLTDELDLTDEQVLKLSRGLKAIGDRQHELRARRQALEAKINEILDTAKTTKAPVDAAALQPLIKDALAVDHDLALLPEETTAQLIGILTVEQQAKLVLFRPKLQRELRGQLRSTEHQTEQHHEEG